MLEEQEPRWQFEKVGLGYRVWSDALQTEFRISRLHRSRGDISGLLQITTNISHPALKTRGGVLHVSSFNLMSSAARNSLSKQLASRTPHELDMDWYDPLEWLCQNVLMAETRGEAVEDVSSISPTPADQRWLVEPLVLLDRPALLFGPGESGKSLLALASGLSVACGREIVPGIRPALHAPVMYLDWETTREDIANRSHAIAAGHGFKLENLFYRRMSRPLAEDAENISTLVDKHAIRFIIVDSAAQAMGSNGEYGDANESALRLHEGLRLLGVTSLIVDHVNQMDAKTRPGKARPYGSIYKINAVRIAWEVRKAPAVLGLAINLYPTKSNDTQRLEPMGLTILMEEGKTVFQSNAPVEEEVESYTTTESVIELLSVRGRLTNAEICEALVTDTTPAPTVRSALLRLVRRERVYKDEAGRYYLPSQPLQLHSLPGSKGIDA